MKTNLKQGRMAGWSARIGIAALALAFAATGFAQPSTGSNKKNSKARAKWDHRKCYVLLSSSPFPQPCDRLGSSPSTATPMTIIGEAPAMHYYR